MRLEEAGDAVRHALIALVNEFGAKVVLDSLRRAQVGVWWGDAAPIELHDERRDLGRVVTEATNQIGRLVVGKW